MESIQHIIFDLGATLLAWDPKLVAERVYKIRPEASLELAHIPATKAWLHFDQGHFSRTELIEALKPDFKEEEAALYIGQAVDTLTLIPEAGELLLELQSQGYKTYILSNMSRDFHEHLHARNPFFNTMAGALFSHEVGRIKPDPEIYRTLLEKFKLNPAESFFLDDMSINVLVAELMGIRGLVWTEAHEIREKLIQLGMITCH